MKIYIDYCFDGREPWSVRLASMKDSRFAGLLSDRGFTVVNFLLPELSSDGKEVSTEACIKATDAIVTFRGRGMLGVSEKILELAKVEHKPVFEFVFSDSGFTLPDFISGRMLTWPQFQQMAINEYEDVFFRLIPIEVGLAQRALT